MWNSNLSTHFCSINVKFFSLYCKTNLPLLLKFVYLCVPVSLTFHRSCIVNTSFHVMLYNVPTRSSNSYLFWSLKLEFTFFTAQGVPYFFTFSWSKLPFSPIFICLFCDPNYIRASHVLRHLLFWLLSFCRLPFSLSLVRFTFLKWTIFLFIKNTLKVFLGRNKHPINANI